MCDEAFGPKREAMPSKRTHTLKRLFGAVCVLCLCPAAFAQEPVPHTVTTVPWILAPVPHTATVSRTGNADHELLVWTQGLLRPIDCSPVPPPAFDLEVPPSHGIVCLRPTNYPIGFTWGLMDHCLGKKGSGVNVIYLPRHGYAGADTLRYTMLAPVYPEKITVNLTIVRDVPALPGAVPADISSPANDTPQSSGPIPPCSALVS
jgi:hypothetical protein